MDSFITYTEFFASGMPVSDDISSDEVTQSIKTVELFFVKSVLGADLYAGMLADPAGYSDEINGAPGFAGLKQAMYHLVFAYMLYDNIRLTRYTSVIKDDERSDKPSKDDLREVAAQHWEIGMSFVYEVAEKLHVDLLKRHNNMIFCELFG